jgi:hypothetical protein
MLADLLSETDRQLGEQRSRSDALANRAGLMIAATALIASFVVVADVPTYFLWSVGGGAAIGVVVLWTSRLVLGPEVSRLSTLLMDSELASDGNEAGRRQLFQAKLIAVEANAHALSRSESLFTLQVVLTLASIVILLVVNGG